MDGFWGGCSTLVGSVGNYILGWAHSYDNPIAKTRLASRYRGVFSTGFNIGLKSKGEGGLKSKQQLANCEHNRDRISGSREKNASCKKGGVFDALFNQNVCHGILVELPTYRIILPSTAHPIGISSYANASYYLPDRSVGCY